MSAWRRSSTAMKGAGIVARVEARALELVDAAFVDGRFQVRARASFPLEPLAPALDPLSPQPLADALARALTKFGRGRELRGLTFAQSAFGLVHTELPRARAKVLRALLERHLRQRDVDARAVFADVFRGSADERDENSLLGWIDAEAAQGLRTELDRQRIRARGLVPPMLALVRVVQRTLSSSSGVVAVVDVRVPTLSIFVFEDGRLNHARILRDALADATVQAPDVVLAETQRSVSYFREKRRGRSFDSVLVSGLERDGAATLARWLSVGLGVGVEPLAAFGDDPNDVVVAGLVLAPDTPFDLLPPHRVRATTLIAASSVIALVSVAGVTWPTYLEARAVARSLEHDVTSARALLTELRNDEAHAHELLERRTWLEDAEHVLGQVGAREAERVVPTVECLVLAPRELVVEELAYEAGSKSMRLSVRGRFQGRDVELLERFVRTLSARPWCRAVELAPPPADVVGSERSEAIRLQVTLR